MKEAFDSEARSAQQSVCDAVREAAKETRGSFANASAAIDKKLIVIVGRGAGTDKSAWLVTSLLHTASRGAQAGASSSRPSLGHGPQKEAPQSATPNLPGAHDPPDHSEYGA